MELDAQRNLNQDVPSPVNVFWIRVWEIVNSQWDKVFAKFVAFLRLSLGETIFRMTCSRGIDEEFNAIDISHVLSYVSLPSRIAIFCHTGAQYSMTERIKARTAMRSVVTWVLQVVPVNVLITSFQVFGFGLNVSGFDVYVSARSKIENCWELCRNIVSP